MTCLATASLWDRLPHPCRASTHMPKIVWPDACHSARFVTGRQASYQRVISCSMTSGVMQICSASCTRQQLLLQQRLPRGCLTLSIAQGLIHNVEQLSPCYILLQVLQKEVHIVVHETRRACCAVGCQVHVRQGPQRAVFWQRLHRKYVQPRPLDSASLKRYIQQRRAANTRCEAFCSSLQAR